MAQARAYRRRIRITTGTGQARADLEDNPHRHGVIVSHDGQRVTSIQGLTLRTPWSLCASAAAMLDRLQGIPIGTGWRNFYQLVDSSLQCTHMADLAALAIAHAARGTPVCQYDVQVNWSPDGRQQLVAMAIDGQPFLDWVVEGNCIRSPEPWAGQDLRKIMQWVEDRNSDPLYLEAIQVLRRAIFISGSSRLDLDSLSNAADTGHVNGACYVFRPGVAEHAIRIKGSTLDFNDARNQLMRDLDD